MREHKNTAIFTAFDDADGEHLPEGERALLQAILVCAMQDISRPGVEGRRAAEYFLSKEEDYIFSFRSICNYLKLDTDRLLLFVGVRQKREQKAKRTESPTVADPKVSE